MSFLNGEFPSKGIGSDGGARDTSSGPSNPSLNPLVFIPSLPVEILRTDGVNYAVSSRVNHHRLYGLERHSSPKAHREIEGAAMAGTWTTLSRLLDGSDASVALVRASQPPVEVTRRALRASAARCGAQLANLGLQPGDVVSIALPNSVNFVAVFFGAACQRFVAAPLNPKYTKEEFLFYMQDAKSKVLVTPGDGSAKEAEDAAKECGAIVVRSAGLEKVQLNVQGKAQRSDADTSNRELLELPTPEPQDVALFLHTSGTTSRPKGVPLTHANLCASVKNITGTYELNQDDVTYLVMPLFHVHGLMAGLLSTLATCGKVVLPAHGAFSASSFWKDVVTHRVTWYTAVPTIHQVLLSRADKDYPKDTPPKLRFIRSCSSSLAAPVLIRLEKAFNAPVLEAYAMTEASHQMTSNPLPKYGTRKPGTVGRGTNVKVAILDSSCSFLPPEKIGEVCIQGPNVTKGYLNRPEANEEAFAGGWFHTGDQGFMDEEGYVTLTGRIKELINRGGEKISPLEIDAALLSHPLVSEAVSFGMPDEKYGEEVGAAVILKAGASVAEAKILGHVSKSLAAFKVPKKLFITDNLPRTATGKIQRRIVSAHFLKTDNSSVQKQSHQHSSSTKKEQRPIFSGHALVAKSLAKCGVKYMFGVVGIPVTQLASEAEKAGIKYVGMRNEQAAGYAAGAVGYLTGKPAAFLTVSGPGVIHGLAGLANAKINCWPVIMVSGSVERNRVGLGGFQELDQIEATRKHCKLSLQADILEDIPNVVSLAYRTTMQGRPGPTYVDIPADLLTASIAETPSLMDACLIKSAVEHALPINRSALAEAANLLSSAQRPLIVVGKGAGFARAEEEIRELANLLSIPCLATPMGKGIIPDKDPLCVAAARSKALKGCDVALVIGARLNWLLHYGQPPNWAPGCKFILVDISGEEILYRKPSVGLVGDAKVVTAELLQTFRESGLTISGAAGWAKDLQQSVVDAKRKLKEKVAKSLKLPALDFYSALSTIESEIKKLSETPIIVSEGANTMDFGRVLLSFQEARSRLDAGTWGTMGVGLGYAIGAATALPGRLVLAVEGDSAFGFSAAECEVICRLNLPIVIFVFNNNGIYGGDRRPKMADSTTALKPALAPTDFVKSAHHERIMEAFGGRGMKAESVTELREACHFAFKARAPCLIDIAIDPMAGTESGHVTSFNEAENASPLSKL